MFLNVFSFSNTSSKHVIANLLSRLRDKIPEIFHAWCYTNVLNLVMSDTSQSLPTTIVGKKHKNFQTRKGKTEKVGEETGIFGNFAGRKIQEILT